MVEKYKRDYSVFKDSLLVSVIVTVILIFCGIMGDAFAEPFQIMLGGTNQEIKESSNVFLFRNNLWIFPLTLIGTFITSYVMLLYLQSGFKDGIIPYDRDIYGRRTYINDEFITKCYNTKITDL